MPLSTKTQKPECTCGHSHAMHRLGPCALYKGKGVPDSCWCDEYDPRDNFSERFPVEPIPYKEEGE